MADQIKQCSDTMSEHCLNVISGSDHVSKNVIKIGNDFGVNFWKKPWAVVHAFSENLLLKHSTLLSSILIPHSFSLVPY